MEMKYQKTSTGFRIGAAVGIIILMLGVATVLNISATSTMGDQMKIITTFNIPLEKTATKMNNLQKMQEVTTNETLVFMKMKDVKDFQNSRSELYQETNLIANEIGNARTIVGTAYETLPQEYINSSAVSISGKLDHLEELNMNFLQDSNRIFATPVGSGASNTNFFSSKLKIEEKESEAEQKNLMTYLEASDKSIETSADANKQKLLTLEVILIISAGIISLTSSHFVNQINKDLIREVIKKTKSLQKANEKLRRSNVLKDEFISEASHELKSPLNPILGFVELAKCGDIDKEEALSGIAKQARQIEEIANKMLDLGRIDNSRLKLTVERFNLNDLVEEISETAWIGMDDRVKIITAPTGTPVIEADRTRIGQVIRNMLNNSLKFTTEGNILISTYTDGANAEVRVRDTGIGIHPDILPRMFDKFATKSHNSENLNGSGLGLYISKGIVEAHNGRMGAFNNPDRGATVFFSIPITCRKKNDALEGEVLI